MPAARDKTAIEFATAWPQITSDIEHLRRLQAGVCQVQETLRRAHQAYVDSLDMLRRVGDTKL